MDDALRRFFVDLFPEAGLEGAVAGMARPPPAIRAAFEAAELASAQAGLAKLVRRDPLDDHERAAARILLHQVGRPALPVVDGSFTAPPGPWHVLARGTARDAVVDALPAVGRLEVPDHPRQPIAGTATLVGDGLLLTARHAVQPFADRAGLHRSADWVVGGRRLPIRDVVCLHPGLDVALLRVDREVVAPLRLAHAPVASRTAVAVLAHPVRSGAQPARLQDRVLGPSGALHVLPGHAHPGDPLRHDACSLGADSGAPVIRLSDGALVGVHVAGRLEERAVAVPASALVGDRSLGPWLGGVAIPTLASGPLCRARAVLGPVTVRVRIG